MVKITKETIEAVELARFDHENFPEGIRMDEEEWEKGMVNGYCAVYVARNEREEMAANLVIKTSSIDVGVWYFYSVAVAEKYRRMGLAKRIFHEAIKSEFATGIINSHCHVDNEPSIALHKSLGFKAIQYVPDFYGDCEDAILWELPL
jgi:ribosomal protein S18 acetylase RimI-like enzyme